MNDNPPAQPRKAATVALYDWNSTLWHEDQASQQAANRFYGVEVAMKLAVDAMPPLLKACGVTADVETDAGAFQSFAWHRFLQAPLSLRATYTLLERGHVQDALTLVRRHIETLAAIHYFALRPAELKGHRLGERRVNFKTMLNVVAPGLYGYYTNFLSEAAHSGGTVEAHLAMDSSDPVGGVTHDENWISTVQNWAVPIALAYPSSMPGVQGIAVLPLEAKLGFDAVRAKYAEWQASHMKVNPRSSRFYGAISPLLGLRASKSAGGRGQR